MMMLGMSAYLNNEYEIKSNRESGNGRSDIILKSKRKEFSSYILEFKYTKDDHIDLKDLANQAVEQIINNYYDIGINGKIIYIGLAHRKKECEIVWQNKS